MLNQNMGASKKASKKQAEATKPTTTTGQMAMSDDGFYLSAQNMEKIIQMVKENDFSEKTAQRVAEQIMDSEIFIQESTQKYRGLKAKINDNTMQMKGIIEKEIQETVGNLNDKWDFNLETGFITKTKKLFSVIDNLSINAIR